jgi:transcriptional regulator with XRE-family HTH domain
MDPMNGDLRSLQPDVADELVRIGGEAYEWRRRAGLTQRAMEALTGIDQTTICKFEKGRLPGFRLHHVARIRLACKTGRRVEPAYGRRQPTRPFMTPDSSRTADDFGARTGKSREREGVSRNLEDRAPPGNGAASEAARNDQSIDRASRAPRRR